MQWNFYCCRFIMKASSILRCGAKNSNAASEMLQSFGCMHCMGFSVEIRPHYSEKKRRMRKIVPLGVVSLHKNEHGVSGERSSE
jgi:hypothetical protein